MSKSLPVLPLSAVVSVGVASVVTTSPPLVVSVDVLPPAVVSVILSPPFAVVTTSVFFVVVVSAGSVVSQETANAQIATTIASAKRIVIILFIR